MGRPSVSLRLVVCIGGLEPGGLVLKGWLLIYRLQEPATP